MNDVAADHGPLRDHEEAFDTYYGLRQKLANHYSDSDDWRRVAEDCGLNPASLKLEGKSINVWSGILGTVRRRNRINLLIALVRNEYPEIEGLARQHAADVESGAYVAPDSDDAGGQSKTDAAPDFLKADTFMGAYRRHVFGGRDGEIAALNAWLAGDYETLGSTVLGGTTASTRLLITAPAGRGKSALLVRWMDQLDKRWAQVFVPISIRYRSNEELTFYQALATGLGRVLGEGMGGKKVNPTAYYHAKAIEYMERIAKGNRPCVVVIDGLDEARGWELARDLIPASSPNLRIVVSAREQAGDHGAAEWLGRLDWDDACTLEVEALSLEGVRNVLGRMTAPIVALSHDPDITAELYRLTEEGDPFLLHLYVKELVKLGDKVARLTLRDLQARRPGFGPYFKRWLKEQETEWKKSGERVDRKLQQHVLAVLASACGPLKLADLAEVVGRVYRHPEIFTSDSIEPLRRFILGDGFDTGYVLTHPKLAIFLEQEHFGVTNAVLRKTKAAFLKWMGEVVEGVNKRDLLAEQVPEYALLFYTQHLAMEPTDRALPLYRTLLEDGWRRAWEAHSAGSGGFFRDVELAQQAFQAAVDRDPAQLQKPRIGLGALIRCVLCLSSGRSIGVGIPGTLLAGFLRSGNITAQQTMRLIEMKEGKARAESIQAVFERLPDDQKEKALGLLGDVDDTSVRVNTVLAILPQVPVPRRPRVAREVLPSVERLKYSSQRLQALEKLKDLLPADTLLAAVQSEQQRGEEEKRLEKEQRSAASSSSEPRPADGQHATPPRPEKDFQYYDQLEQEAGRADLSVERMRQILDATADDGYHYRAVVQSLSQRLPEDLLDLVIDWVCQNSLYRHDVLESILPRLGPQRARQTLQAVLTRSNDYGIDAMVDKLAGRVTEGGFDAEVEIILQIKEPYHRTRALSALAPRLSSDLRMAMLRLAFDWPAHHTRRVLEAFAKDLAREQVEEATTLVMGMSDMEERGLALAVLLPRHDELGIPLKATDAYQMASTIGDRPFQALSHAALLSHLDPGRADAVRAELATQVIDFSPSASRDMPELKIVNLLLTSNYIATSAESLEQFLSMVRLRIDEPERRAVALAAIATRLPPARAMNVFEEAVELARAGKASQTWWLFLVLATLFPGPERQALVDEGLAGVNVGKSDAERLFSRLMSVIATGKSVKKSEAETIDVVQALMRLPKSEERTIYLALGIMLCPRIPSDMSMAITKEAFAEVWKLSNETDQIAFAVLLLAYLPPETLRETVQRLLTLGGTLSRPVLLSGLALLHGLANEMWIKTPAIAGNRIPGSPLARLGGKSAVVETYEAICDVCNWWR